MSDPTTAIAVIKPDANDSWEPKTIEILGNYPPERFNRLVPTVSLRQVNPYLVPDVETVQLNPNPDAGEIYHDTQMKEGHYAPTKVGLRLIAQVMGLTTISSRRVDDGRDPDYIEWQVELEMVQPSGRPIRGFGTKQIDLRAARVKGKTPAWIAKAHEHMVANAESKAMNRAIRSIASLRPSYPQAQLAKPFAILRYVPDMTHPEVRARFLDMVAPTTTALYGSEPTTAPKQVGPGAEDGVDRAAPVTDDEDQGDDDATEGQVRDVTPTTTASGEPEEALPTWGTDAKPAEPDLFTVIRDSAAASGIQNEPATDAQRTALNEIFRGLGREAWNAGLPKIWDDVDVDNLVLTGAQAQALMKVAQSRGDAFAAEWRAAAGGEATS